MIFKRQFSIKNLFVGIFLTAILLAFVAQEPVSVGLAAFFCVMSWIGILTLSYMTLNHLFETIRQSIRSRQFNRLTSRYRWAYLDSFIATWLFFTIVISNFVLENSIANASYLIWFGWGLWLIALVAIVGRIVWRLQMPTGDADQKV